MSLTEVTGTSVPGDMPPADNHVHTQWLWDTPPEASMERSCERAIELGLPTVAFTEHLDFTELPTGG